MRQGRRDGFREFAAGRSGHLYRSVCLLASGDTQEIALSPALTIPPAGHLASA